MLKAIAMTLLGIIGLSTLSGCVVYPHHHHDDIVVEPAGYRYHDRDWDRHYHDHDRYDRDHWDRY
jgi:hypothetical protein